MTATHPLLGTGAMRRAALREGGSVESRPKRPEKAPGQPLGQLAARVAREARPRPQAPTPEPQAKFCLLTLDELDRLLALSARSGRGVAYLRVTLALVSLIGTGSRCKAASVAEIAQLASTHRSSVSVVLGEMEADGLICRVRHSRGLDIELNPALAWIGATAARAEAVKVWRGRLRR